jgi:hypothetical protein
MESDVMDVTTRTTRGPLTVLVAMAVALGAGPLVARAGRAIIAVIAVAVAAVALGALSGCSGEGSDVSCSVNACTVTFDRGVDASASVLGIKVKLVEVKNGQVTVDVDGNQLTVPVDGSAQSGGGISVSVQKVTDDQVVLQITKS